MTIIVNPSTSLTTKSGIKQRVLEDLGVVQIGQTPQSQDWDRIERGYLEEYDKLKELGIATWSVTGDIPNKMVPNMVALVAWNAIVSGSYGVSQDRYARIQLAFTQAEREIRRMGRKYESLEEPTDY